MSGKSLLILICALIIITGSSGSLDQNTSFNESYHAYVNSSNQTGQSPSQSPQGSENISSSPHTPNVTLSSPDVLNQTPLQQEILQGGQNQSSAQPELTQDAQNETILRQDAKGNSNNKNGKEKEPFAEDELIVTFRMEPGRKMSDEVAARTHKGVGATVKKNFDEKGLSGTQVVKIPPGLTVDEAIALYEGDAAVLSVQPNYRIELMSLPDDPDFSLQWGLMNTNNPGADIGAANAWNLSTGNPGVLIAIPDTGIDISHPDLAENIWCNTHDIDGDAIDDDGNGYTDDVQGWDFVNDDANPTDDNGHGTHVAGIAGAVGNNHVGITGVMWDAQILPLKVIGADGYGYESDAIEAILYARQAGAQVISISWGSYGESQALAEVIASYPGLVVCAAGNSVKDNDLYPLYPASYGSGNIISVTATDEQDNLAPFANYGAGTVDIAAPGVGIYSTIPGSGYDVRSGTSMAAPYVAGVAGLVLSARENVSGSELANILIASSDRMSILEGKISSSGRVNASAALIVAKTGNSTIQELDQTTPLIPVSGNSFEGLDDVQDSLRISGKNWIARETSISAMPNEEFRKMLGVIPSSLSSTEYEDSSEAQTTYESISVPSPVDWRNNGGDWTTPIKNQGGCGSCWAFGTLGTFEARTEISADNPNLNPDYSEQELVSCAGCGGCSGSSMICPQNWLLNNGAILETCFPYVASNTPCSHSCTTRYKIFEWHRILPTNNETAIKEALTRGPIIGTFAVYADFKYYSGGVYEYTSGDFLGYHAITVVGWEEDETGAYWICKNSWGTSWGEASPFTGERGWFRIRSGDSMINNELYELSVNVPKPVAGFNGTPLQGLKPLTVQFNDTSTNIPSSWHWVFGDGCTSSEQNPMHTYEGAATYDVTLSVGNAFGTDSITKTDYITVVDPPAFLDSWSYRKLVTIAGSPDGDLTDYQMRFVIHRGEGVDNSEHVYLGTLVNENYSDIRFTTIANAQLPYWIESSDSNSATVWVRIPSIPSSGMQIYLCYGNSGASPASNGDTTFLFFDGFTESAINSTKWTSHIGTGASIVITDGIAQLTTGSGSGNRYAALEGKSTFGPGYVYAARQRSYDTGTRSNRYSTYGFGTHRANDMALSSRISGSDGIVWRDALGTDTSWYARTYVGTTRTKNDKSDPISTAFRQYQVTRKSGGTDIEWAIEGTVKTTHANSKVSSSLPPAIGIDTSIQGSGSEIIDSVDWIYVRKYTLHAPTVSVWGAQVEAPADDYSYSIVHISDTQKLSRHYPSTLNYTFSYLESIKSKYNITGIIISGDLVDDGSNQTQWINYANARSFTTIPLYEVSGNHDLAGGYTNYDTYIGAGKRNWTSVINDFLFIGIGYTRNELSETDLNYYKDLIESNPSKIPLFATHNYFDGVTYPAPLSDLGQSIKSNLIVRDPTFIMCGHMHGNILHSDKYNQKILVEDMTNYQTFGDYSAGKLFTVYKKTGTINTISSRDLYIYPFPSFGLETIVYPSIIGKDRIALFRPSTNMWYLDYDNNGLSDYRVTWGDSSDVPVTGDWDGDGKDEIGLWRPSTNMWYLDYDNNGLSDFRVTWGDSSDIPVTGDWDGDGKDEIGLWRPSTNMWYLDYDNNGLSDFRVTWGDSSDIPVTGDWDGDGKDEIGLWRPSTNMWYLDYDNNGLSDYRVIWGDNKDKPITGTWT